MWRAGRASVCAWEAAGSGYVGTLLAAQVAPSYVR